MELGHSNRPEVQNLGNYFTSKGYFVAALDFQGHGYSEGERALVLSHDDLIDDLLSFIESIRSRDEKNLNPYVLDSQHKQLLTQLPYFVMGQSMGGGITAMASNKLLSDQKYLGSVLLAPYLGVANVPHWIILNILKYTFVACFPNSQMPEWLDHTADPRSTWKREETIRYAELDTWGQPGAIGYNLPMKWGTAGMFIEMGLTIKSSLSQMSYPFLIIHDPEDMVTSFEGSRNMFNESLTPHEEKELIEATGYRHGTLSNHPNEICEMVWSWIEKRNSRS